MKQFKYFIALAVGLMVTACSSSDYDYALSKRKEIKFSIGLEEVKEGTRAGNYDIYLLKDFVADDEVTIATVENSSRETVMQKKYVSDGNWITSGTTTSLYYPANGSNAEIYAVSPKVSSMLSFLSGEFTVKADQFERANYKSSDLLFVSLSKAPSDATIPITLEHACAQIYIEVSEENGSGYYWEDYSELKITNVYLSGAFSSGKFAANTSSSKGSVSLGRPEASTNGANYGLIPPQTVPINTDLFEVTCGTETYKYTTTTALEFKGGYKYTIKLKITKTGVSLSSLTKGTWTDEAVKDFNMTKQ